MLTEKMIHDFAGPLSSVLLILEMMPNPSVILVNEVEKLKDILEFYRLVIKPGLNNISVKKFLTKICDKREIELVYQEPSEPVLALAFAHYAMVNKVKKLSFEKNTYSGINLRTEIIDVINTGDTLDIRHALWQLAHSDRYQVKAEGDTLIILPNT